MSVDEDIAQDSEPMRGNPVMALVMRARTVTSVHGTHWWSGTLR
jgi:hypothetical protein